MECLDSWAVLAWLDGDQPAKERVEEAIYQQKAVISWINGCEIYYRIARMHSEAVADQTIQDLKQEMLFDLPLTRMVLHAARLKAKYPIALADCFAIATAILYNSLLLTGDPEIINIQDLSCEVLEVIRSFSSLISLTNQR